MRVILHRVDEMEDVTTPLLGVKVYNQVKGTLGSDLGFVPLSEII